jgi:hypothetical protein
LPWKISPYLNSPVNLSAPGRRFLVRSAVAAEDQSTMLTLRANDANLSGQTGAIVRPTESSPIRDFTFQKQSFEKS